ncbi:hypothetical protein LZ31DRAFT_143427 [Colletotrichum somersetense]|nr:hypothetical protein LZ31DRAFT_143427 [Colletotrichum somersetense]
MCWVMCHASRIRIRCGFLFGPSRSPVRGHHRAEGENDYRCWDFQQNGQVPGRSTSWALQLLIRIDTHIHTLTHTHTERERDTLCRVRARLSPGIRAYPPLSTPMSTSITLHPASYLIGSHPQPCKSCITPPRIGVPPVLLRGARATGQPYSTHGGQKGKNPRTIARLSPCLCACVYVCLPAGTYVSSLWAPCFCFPLGYDPRLGA